MSRVPLKEMKALLDLATYTDDYGVFGSEFIVCRICESESGAGMLFKEGWHKPHCPIPKLKRKYDKRGTLKEGDV